MYRKEQSCIHSAKGFGCMCFLLPPVLYRWKGAVTPWNIYSLWESCWQSLKERLWTWLVTLDFMATGTSSTQKKTGIQFVCPVQPQSSFPLAICDPPFLSVSPSPFRHLAITLCLELAAFPHASQMVGKSTSISWRMYRTRPHTPAPPLST